MRNPIAIILNTRYWGSAFERWHNADYVGFTKEGELFGKWGL